MSRARALLLLHNRDRVQIRDPRLMGAEPDLPLWGQIIALARGGDAKAIDLRPASHRGGIKVGPAFGTKHLGAFVAAFGGLDVGLEVPSEKLEVVFGSM